MTTGVKLNLLGGFSLTSDEGADLRLPPGKGRALLSYLALNLDEAQARGKLAELLWGDQDEAHARANLSQCLFRLRKALGDGGGGILEAEKESVRLNATRLDVDALALNRLADARDMAGAAALCTGPLLDGFMTRQEGFEDWLAQERANYASLMEDVLTRHVEERLAVGETTAAIMAARRLLAMNGLNEAAHRLLMRAYAAAGRRDAALQQYRACAEALRRELDVAPETATETLYEDLQRDAARNSGRERSDHPKLPDQPSIAVLPFGNLSADPEQEFFADGIAADVITALSRFRSLFVIARNSSFTYKGQSVDIGRVGRDLGVRYVVEGSVRKSGNRVRIAAQLIDASSGNYLWADRMDGSPEDVFDLQDRITEKIVVAVVPEIDARERDRARRKPPGRLDAWELLQRGLSFSNFNDRSDTEERFRLYRQAIERDPEFAAAYAYLALHLYVSVIFGLATDTKKAIASARRAARTAVSLDPREPVGHLALGRVHLHDGASEMAINAMRTAIEINPSFAFGHQSLGFAWFFGAGRPDRSLLHLETALRLSPRSDWRWATLMNMGIALLLLGRYEEAVGHLRQACQSPNKGFLPGMWLAAALAEAGHEPDARAALEQAMALQPALSVDYFRNHRTGIHEITLNTMIRSLRKAGVPERSADD